MPQPVAPPGYVPAPSPIPGVGFMGMVQYLKSRGYSDDLAHTLAANIEANQGNRGNAELITGAQAWAAKNAPGIQDASPALGAQNLKDQYAAGQAAQQAQGQKTDSLASYFQRLGIPADQAISLARHTTGVPDSTGKAPMDHAQTQVAEHPPIPPELYQSVLGTPQTPPGK